MVQQTNILKAWNANKEEEKNGAYPMLNEKKENSWQPKTRKAHIQHTQNM